MLSPYLEILERQGRLVFLLTPLKQEGNLALLLNIFFVNALKFLNSYQMNNLLKFILLLPPILLTEAFLFLAFPFALFALPWILPVNQQITKFFLSMLIALCNTFLVKNLYDNHTNLELIGYFIFLLGLVPAAACINYTQEIFINHFMQWRTEAKKAQSELEKGYAHAHKFFSSTHLAERKFSEKVKDVKTYLNPSL